MSIDTEENMNEILVVVDYQNDFVDGALGFDKARELEEIIVSEVRDALSKGEKVFFTLDTHDDGYAETREGKHLPMPHCIDGTDGHSLYGKTAEFSEESGVTLVKKSGFGSSSLPDIIKQTCGVPDTVRICGVVTNMCVIANAIVLQTAFENADIRILEKACASFDEKLHDEAVDVMRNMHMTIEE